ncbi:MAG: PaaI family thioesterase [Gemmatimonadales bacterium]|nr:PaaI family thioesterase [Gemmatimonadales bacterium]
MTEAEQRVRDSFSGQRVMATIGASLARVLPGEVDIALPYRGDLTQQHGFLHAGIVATIADSACGYAAFSLMPAGVGVLSIEYKINLLAPARGERFVARGRVVRAGRTVTVCQADVYAEIEGKEQLIATQLASIMTIRDRPEVVG